MTALMLLSLSTLHPFVYLLLGIVPAVVSAVFNALPQTVDDAHHVGAAGEGATGR